MSVHAYARSGRCFPAKSFTKKLAADALPAKLLKLNLKLGPNIARRSLYLEICMSSYVNNFLARTAGKSRERKVRATYGYRCSTARSRLEREHVLDHEMNSGRLFYSSNFFIPLKKK